MKKKQDVLAMFLATVTGAALLVCLLLRAFLPRVILPQLNLTSVTVLSLAALVLDHYIAKPHSRNYLLLWLYGALIFGLLPLSAGFAPALTALKLALLGAAVLPVITFLFDTMIQRLSSGPVAKLAPVVCAFGLYLAAQALMGIS